MAALFERAAQVTISKPTGFFAPGANAVVIRDLRVRIQAEKHLGREPNTCTVIVDNLSETTRAALQTKPLHVLVEAGYAGQVQRLFSGDVRWAQSRRLGVQWETTLQIADGDRAYRHARVLRSYRGGVDVATAVREAATAMGLEVPAAVEGLRQQFAAGLALRGRASDVMSRLLEPTGYDWSIQDGRLQLLREGDVRVDQAAVISQDTGMVDTPELGAPTDPPRAADGAGSSPRIGRGKPILSVRTLLYPGLVPGGRILMKSRSINGLYKVLRLAHTGDTRGLEWFTDVEATPL